MKNYQKAFIELALKQQALKFGSFTLKSGRQSPYFFNLGTLTDAHSLHVLGTCYAQAIIDRQINAETFFGPAYKGIPIASATAVMYYQLSKTNPSCAFDRKEIKDHGEGGQIVGNLSGNTLILDDVITAGTAIKYAIELIKTHGATPSAILVALDRQEKGNNTLSAIFEIQQQYKIPIHAIITFKELLEYIHSDPALATYQDAMLNYQQQYGAT